MADSDSLPTLLRPLLEWLGVVDGGGNVNLDWFKAPAPALKAAITANLPELIGVVTSLLGARDASGLGLVVNEGDTWYPLSALTSDPGFAAYLVLTQQGAGVDVSVGLRTSVGGPPPVAALTARVPLVALDGKGGVAALLGGTGALDLAVEVDQLKISEGQLKLAGARFGIQIPFAGTAPKVSLDLLGASLGNEAAHTISLSDFTAASPDLLLELVRAALGGNALYDHIADALGLDGARVPLLSWSSVATGGAGAIIAWLAQIAASPSYSSSWTASVQQLLGLSAPSPVVLALGLTADGFAPTFTVNLTAATPAGNGAQAGTQVVRAVLAPFSLSFHGAPAVCPVGISMTLRMDGASPAVPLVAVAVPAPASVQAAEIGFNLTPGNASPVQLICRLEGVTSGAQTWPVVDMTQLSTTISVAAAGATTQLSSLLSGAYAILQLLGLVTPTPQGLALLASDPLRALDCFWKAQDPIAPTLDAIATSLGLPLANPVAPDAPWGVSLVGTPSTAVQFDIGVIAPIPLVRPYRTLFASVEVATRFVGGGIAVDASIEPRLLEYVNGERCAGVTPTSAAWLPQIELVVNLSSPVGKFTIAAPPLTIAFDALSIDVIWRVGLPPIPIIEISGLTVALAAGAPIALPKISWASAGAGFDLELEGLGLSLPDFGIGRSSVDSLLWLLGFAGRRSGPLGFACSLLFGWQANLGALAGNGWAWPKFAAAANPGLDWGAWPTMSPGTWGAPWSWAKLASDPRSALSMWWQLLFSDRLRVRAALWLFGSACFGALPDPRLALDGTGALPPVQLTGSGTYADPWAVSVLKPGIRELELIVWVEGLVDGVGWGFRLRPLKAFNGALLIETKIRVDVGFVSVSGKAAAEPIPAFHIATTIERANGTPLAKTAAGGITSVTFGARVSSSPSLLVTPEITVEGNVTLRVTAGQPLPAGMRDALAAVFTAWGAGQSAGFGVLAELLVQLGLAINTGKAYGLHPNGLDTLAANPTNFAVRLLTSAWTNPKSSKALIQALAGVLGPWVGTVVGAGVSSTWKVVGQLLVALGWATDGSFPCYPKVDAALALLEDPATALMQAGTSLAAGDTRATLRSAVAGLTGAGPVPLGAGLTISMDAKGVIALALEGPLGANPLTPLTPSATLTVDTTSAAVALAVGLSGGTAGVAIAYGAGTEVITVTLAGQSATLDAAGFPDLFTCAGRMVIAAIAGAGIERAVVATPGIAPLFTALGFVRSTGAGDPTFADSLVELLSPKPNLSAWQARLGLGVAGGTTKAKAAIVAAISPWAPALITAAGHITYAASGLNFDATLGAGDSLSPTVTLGISQLLAPSAGGAPAVRAPASKPAAARGAATLAVTRAAGATTLDLTVGSSVVHLIPFGGLTSLLGAAASAAAPQLLPWAVNLLATNLPGAPNLLKLGAAIGIDSIQTAQAWAAQPAKKLLAAFSQPALSATIQALATIPGVIAKPASIGISYGADPSWTLQAAVGAGGALLPPSLQLTATHSVVNGAKVLDLAGEISITGPNTFAFTAVVSPQLSVGYGIAPALRMTTKTGSPLVASLYPFGTPVNGSTVIRIDLVPKFYVMGENSAGASAAFLPEALETFARQVVLPEAIGWILSNSNFLNTPGPGEVLAQALKQAGVIALAGNPPIWTVTNPTGSPVANLLNGITTLLGAASAWFPQPSSPSAYGLSLYSSDSEPPDVGVRITTAPVQLSSSPSVVLTTQTDPAGKWAGSKNDDGLPGIVVVLLSDKKFAPKLFGTVGLSLDGTAEQPLLGPIGTVSLDGLDAWVRPSITFSAGTPFEIAYWGRLRGVTVPMSLVAGGGGLVAALTGGDASSTTPTNAPKITAGIQVPTEGGPVLDFSGSITIPIQAGFGPLHIGSILVSASGSSLNIGLDAGVNVGGLDVELDDLGVSIPVTTPFTPATWQGTLTGLGISYDSDDVSISGQLLRTNGPPVSFDGQCSLEVAGYGLGAIGGFAPGAPPSFYIFAALDAPIGGPPCFFITGVAAGFGYNRGINVPDVSAVGTFPLIQAFGAIPTSASAPLPAPGTAIAFTTGETFPVMRGSGWFALGLKFTTFVVIQGRAVAYVELGDGVEVGIVGEANLVLPTDDAAIVSIDLLLRARFSTKDGVFSIEARLSDSSWLFTQDCRLTGGFAFYIWFGESHRGDFVITLGGYHPQFSPPPYYPTCPRLGFAWTPTSSVVIKGESYFALTPHCVMAGGCLDARYSAGGVQAWFTAYADILVSWKPFYYEFDVGISIGVKCWACSVELSASVTIWGPQFSAEVHVSVFCVSFTVAFGAADSKTPPALLHLPDFLAMLPSTSTQERALVGASVASGLLPRSGPNDIATRVGPAFALKVETSFALYRVEAFGSAVPTSLPDPVEVDFAPMGRLNANPTLVVTMTGSSGLVIPPPGLAIVLGNAPVTLWYVDPAGAAGALTPTGAQAAYDSIPRGVVLTFVPEPAGYFGWFYPAGDPAEYVSRQRWNPLLLSLPVPARATRTLALQRGSGAVALKRPPAPSQDQPTVRFLPLAADLELRATTREPAVRDAAPPVTRRARLERPLQSTRMAHITLPAGYRGKLTLDRRARVIELDRAGAVRSDRLLVGATSLSKHARVLVIGAPVALGTNKDTAVVGWTERSELVVISATVLVGAGCVITLSVAPTRFRRRRLGYTAQPAALVGAAIAEQGGFVTSLSASGRLRTVGVLVELRPKASAADPLEGLVVSPSWTTGSVTADHAVVDGSRVLLLYACPHAGGSSAIRVESTESLFVHGVVGFRQSVSETAETVAASGLDTMLRGRPAQRTHLTYALKED